MTPHEYELALAIGNGLLACAVTLIVSAVWAMWLERKAQ